MNSKPVTFSFHGPSRPPVSIPEDRTWYFLCVVCGKPGVGRAPSANTHEGECRRERQRQNQARAMAAFKSRRKQAAEKRP